MAPRLSAFALFCVASAPLAAGLYIAPGPEQEADRKLMRTVSVDGRNPTPCDWRGFLTDCEAHLERLKVVEVEKPVPKKGEALVRIRASSINAHDWEDLMHADMRRSTLGLDLAGTVEAVGAGCGWKPGDEVWGTGFDNTDAEYAAIRCGMLGRKPANLTFVEAASLPIVGTTGLGALWKAGAPWNRAGFERRAPTVLVLGGAGGSGSAGIQLAKAFGAGEVITTCSPSNFDLVRSLGADKVIDYHTSQWWEALGKGSVDVIYDCVTADGTGEHAYEILRDGGTLVSLLPNGLAPLSLARQRPSVKQVFYLNIMDKSTRHLDMLRQLVEEGRLRPAVDSVYGLGEVREAFRRAVGRHVAGKIVLRTES